MLRFEDGEDFLELDVDSQEGEGTPAAGDARLTVRVASAGFTGRNDLWVSHDSLRQFCAALVLLERDRRGRAELSSISPQELTLTVHAIDSRGHMAVEGSTGYGVERAGAVRWWHAVQFGFAFEPAQLTTAAAVGWVRRNVEGKSRP